MESLPSGRPAAHREGHEGPVCVPVQSSLVDTNKIKQLLALRNFGFVYHQIHRQKMSR